MLVGCVEMGVVNVPRLLAKGAHNEVEQWEQAAEGMLSTDTSDRAPYIGNLAVSPRQRRRGVGTQLMRAAVAYAQHEWHSTAVWLHVEAENEAAKRLYARLGFDCEVQEPTWYRHIGRDRRLFLRCDIAPEGEGGVADDLVTGDAGEDGGVDDEEVEMQLKAWEDARVGGKPVRGLEYLRYCWYDLGRRRRENGG